MLESYAANTKRTVVNYGTTEANTGLIVNKATPFSMGCFCDYFKRLYEKSHERILIKIGASYKDVFVFY